MTDWLARLDPEDPGAGLIYYGLHGQRISRDEFLRLWAPDAAGQVGSFTRRVAYAEKGGTEVSTVWLGLDHGFGYGPPLIFETMIFGGEHDNDTWRYATLDEALEGHQRACLVAFGGQIGDEAATGGFDQ